MSTFRIETDDLTRPQVLALLEEHLANMYAITPHESVHALDVSQLKGPDITFWTVWDGDQLVGCGALKEHSPAFGEVKSMRTPQALRRRGAGRVVLEHIIKTARERGYKTLSLETGADHNFVAARSLYAKFGFTACGPFADYTDDPNSAYMTLTL